LIFAENRRQPLATLCVHVASLAVKGLWRLSTATALALSLAAALWTPATAGIYGQYQVKAVFLYNLTNFIEWPANNDPASHRPFIIRVLGHDTLGGHLDQAVAGETVNSRNIRIERIASLSQIQSGSCDLLFINADQMHLWPQIREIVRAHPVLTVSDVEGFCHRGGIVNLLTAGRKICIEINMEEARRNLFEISAKLLKLARIVAGGKDD
jgi:hypothetical protein